MNKKEKTKITFPKMSHYDLLIKILPENSIKKPNKNIIYTLHYGLNNKCHKNSVRNSLNLKEKTGDKVLALSPDQ